MLSEKQIRFSIESSEVEIPEDFSKFSGCVADFAKSVCEEPQPEKPLTIVLPAGYTIEQLNLLFGFFDLLKANLFEHHHVSKVSTGCEKQASFDGENEDVNDGIIYEEEDFEGQEYGEHLEPDGAIVEVELEKDPEKLCFPSRNYRENTASDGLINLDYHFKLTKLPEWSYHFLSEVPKDLLFSTSELANYLTAHPFIEHMSLFVANKLKGMSISQIRDYLNVEADFEEDEFDTLAKEESWRDQLIEEGLVDRRKFSKEY